MGSSGRDRLGDMPPRKPKLNCKEGFVAELEDVALSEYFTTVAALPLIGASVRVRHGLLAGRVVVEESLTGLVLGALPIDYSYLILCQEKGFQYEGGVILSSSKPIEKVRVQIDAV